MEFGLSCHIYLGGSVNANRRSLYVPVFFLPLLLIFKKSLYSEKSKLVSDCLFNMGFTSLVH